MYYLYKITNMINNKVYVGQSKNDKYRWRQHKYFARKPELTKQYIHRAMNKYGVENFEYEVIAVCKTQEDANDTETQLIKQYDSLKKGYNLLPGGNNISGQDHPLYGTKASEETKQKMSKSHIGFKHSNETKKTISEYNTGKKLSQSTIDKISNTKKNIPNTWQKGKSPSEESKKKNSESHKGKTHTIETKDRLSKSHKGVLAYNYIKWSPEQINNIKNDSRSSRIIAIEYGVSASTIQKLRKGFYD